ncbi:uncharacterized protein LOC128883475 [Hylaeus volcanicus]|uniref:uncharacterized protein LOC128883475 n=1 Tax=Hylaeus volcanicus TaxID=313075 RepID=UPI0023B7CDDF|nr:uncharacterized protein LOC128883475 [Hylaeus volcanicus]
MRRLFFPGISPAIGRYVEKSHLNAKLKYFLLHPAGPLTIHFWAPTFKWGITLANLADMGCSPQKISWETQLAITATGLIWSRFSLVITPKNWNLFSVNVLMAGSGMYQLFRVYKYKQKKT